MVWLRHTKKKTRRGGREREDGGVKKKKRQKEGEISPAPQVNFLLRGSCVYQLPEERSKPQGVSFLHPPLIQLQHKTDEAGELSSQLQSFISAGSYIVVAKLNKQTRVTTLRQT